MQNIRNNDDVFIRSVMIGVTKVLHNKIGWTNKFSSGSTEVVVPAYYSMSGNDDYLIDAFVDDLPEGRTELNVDQLQRIHVYPTSVSLSSAEQTNPNSYLLANEENDMELNRFYVKAKMVPVNINVTLKARGNSELDVFRIWDGLLDAIYLYKTIFFSFRGIPLYGYISLPDDNEMKLPREIDLKSDSTREISVQLQVNTARPVIDDLSKVPASKRVNWQLKVYDTPTLPEG